MVEVGAGGRQGPKADYALSSIAEVKNMWSYTTTYPSVSMM